MAFKDLPTFYYHTHFMEFLDFVKGPSAHLLNTQHQEFLNAFFKLTHLQQCTVVRLINRKYPAIKIASLRFTEIPNLDDVLPILMSLGFATKVTNENYLDLLSVLTKPELSDIYKQCATADLPALSKSANKASLQAQCARLCVDNIVNSDIATNYIVRNTDTYINYFLFLYFGHLNGKLNQFSMRDLGVMRTRDEQAQMQSRFVDYETAHSCFTMQQVLHQIKRTEFTHIEQISAALALLQTPHGNQAQESFDTAVYLLAKAMLAFEPTRALDMTSTIMSPMAQEFWCRQAYKLGLKNEVKQRLNKLIDEPLSEHSIQFAEDFLDRKFKQKRTSVLSDMLRDSARHLRIDETYKGAVERGVIAYYEARNIKAWRTENRIWKNLFGLCFWHELFELEGLGLATAFDYLPMCIKHHKFTEVAGNEIHQRLENVCNSHDLIKLINKNASAHYGKSQGIVTWRNNMLEQLEVLVNHAPINGIKAHLMTMCENYTLYNDGFPDIMVLENKQLRFEEIKAEGDSLRHNQLMQIQSLQQHGIDVDITTVSFILDPMQPYAIVDIETTGGRAGTHKITEIGIVKMINGEVVDQWQTLINPQRRIPAMITQLTGINNDMVADAPLFADIAEDLNNFTDNCIFVAHNVNFDYGFIREEYARLDRNYRRPKLCTVQQMRKHYKGLPSYSLANLTRHFNISMERHHRALSDAMAAAELLKLVNEKRINSTFFEGS